MSLKRCTILKTIILVLFFYISNTNAAVSNLKFAVVQNGDSTDLGFNYMVNEGRVFIEETFNLSNTQSVYNIFTEEEAYQSFVDLINDGYNLIVSSSLNFGNAIYQVAAEYPNVKFLTRGRGNSTMPNLARISYNVQSADYMSGYFAGMSTVTNTVGIVLPGKQFSTYHQANSFAVGVKAAAKLLGKEIKIYCAATGSYNDADIATVATNLILSKGADIISQIQDDMTVSLISMNRGNLGIGTNGFPQRRVYGEKVGTSYVIDWGVLFMEACDRFLNNTWENGWSFLGDFSNNVIHLDTLSYRVPIDRATLILAEEDRFVKSDQYNPQYCDPSSCTVFNCTNGCVSYNDWSKATVFVPGVEFLGDISIPLTPVEFSKGAKITFSVLATICGVLILLCMVGVGIYRNAFAIRSASPIFCISILFGGLMIFAGVAVWITEPTNHLCRLRYWLVSLGYTIMLGSMVVKNVRIFLLFNNKELKVLKITNSKLFPYVGLALLLNCILLIIWTSIGDIHEVFKRNVDDIGKYEYIKDCYSSTAGNVTLYILLVYHGLMLLVGCFVSFKIRTVDIEDFNESKAIASTLYAIAFCLFIVIPLLISTAKIYQRIIILVASFTFTAASGLMILFIPKFFRIFVTGGDKSSFSSKLTSMTNNIDNLSYFPDEEIPNEYSKKETPGSGDSTPASGNTSPKSSTSNQASSQITTPDSHSVSNMEIPKTAEEQE
ncbi:hypothetical protein CYY_006985 [Polysphondylium violaceum]|uniref:G-protein coupled receptors family 3 profile domain-containing protein n=1 Tax=Polysphondylium violaceum TaxID=133409 RepID=A0A8J4PSJ9_9MYCE|nr:hypothetical protein CYY_006985 [Polysphondylium violaceum]